METDRWREIEQLYHAARECPPGERDQFLKKACADRQVRSEVLALLEREEQAGSFLEAPAMEVAAEALAEGRARSMLGRVLGHYEIVALLGAGGMGEVYRARDTRLKRDVALKVLPETFARDSNRLRRFQREAEVLASLNHPNIAHIYGVEERSLAMELVEGDSPQGPMPFEDAWKIALQMAEGLEFAHERGVVHRDLKPANIKVTPQGTVKLLDFGLAKAYSAQIESAAADPSQSPPVTLDATIAGTIIGTAAYMAPEQARGKPVDKRADIWSWGVVLYELLTGESPFKGEDVADTLAGVMHKQPDLERVPAQARKVLRRCLEKDPGKRLRDIGDAKDLLESVQTVEVTRSRPAPSIGMIAILTVALAALAFVHFRQPPAERPVLQYTVPVPEKAPRVSSFAISPDGRYLAIAASGDGESQIWVRSLDSLQTQALAGTDGAAFPFWSPDSRYIGFFSRDKLKKISVTGGTPQILCDTPGALGGAWSREGVIVFGRAGGLSRVPEAGGVPVNITEAGATTHRWPVFLPNGKSFLYLAPRGPQSGIDLTSLDDPKRTRRLSPEIANPQYVAPQPGDAVGHLLFVRGGTLMAQPVDPKTMDNRGELFPVAQQVSRGVLFGTNLYSVSATGTLVYLNRGGAGATTQHVWLDRTGKELQKIGGPLRSRNTFALSPDGKRVVVERMAGDEANSDLWLMDMEPDGATETRLTFDASINYYPVWSPDGSKVAFASTRNGGVFNLYQRAADGTGQDELLFASKEPTKFPWDWSHDGRFLLFRTEGSKNGLDIWALPVMTQGERKPFVVRSSPFLETQGQLSPDGRWLAYASNESGNEQVYVAPFAPAFDKPIAGKWQISAAGGTQPRWRGDGKELYYVAPDRKLMAVEVKAAALTFDRGAPQVLFELRSSIDASNAFLWGYIPSADGRRFLVAEIPGTTSDAPPPPMTVVVNWLGSVKK